MSFNRNVKILITSNFKFTKYAFKELEFIKNDGNVILNNCKSQINTRIEKNNNEKISFII